MDEEAQMNSHFQACKYDSLPLLPQIPPEFLEADIFATEMTLEKQDENNYSF